MSVLPRLWSIIVARIVPPARTRGAGTAHGRGSDGSTPEAGSEPKQPAQITDEDVCRRPGIVTVRIAGGDVPGEVRVYVRGTWELFIAYALEPIECGAHIRVDASRGHRALDVTWTGPADPPHDQ